MTAFRQSIYAGYEVFVRVDLTKGEFDALKSWIADLPDVTSGPHRFGGIEFKVHGLEFMHFHGQTQLDIRLSKSDQARVLAEGKAEKHLTLPRRAGSRSESNQTRMSMGRKR